LQGWTGEEFETKTFIEVRIRSSFAMDKKRSNTSNFSRLKSTETCIPQQTPPNLFALVPDVNRQSRQNITGIG